MNNEENRMYDSTNNIIMTARQANNMNNQDFYLKGLSVYAKKIKEYTLKIEKLKHKINNYAKQNEYAEQQLQEIENEIAFDDKLLERLNTDLLVKIESRVLLKDELETIEDKSYLKIFERTNKELLTMIDEIETLEIVMLKKELNRLNMVSKLEPKKSKIEELEGYLKEFELEKEHYERTKIYEIPQLGLSEIQTEESEVEEVIDTKIV